MKVSVQQLKVGDVLSGSKEKVKAAPVAGYKTPRGKVELVLETKFGTTRYCEWGKYTLVNIEERN